MRRLRSVRQRRLLTQKELAELVGVDEFTIIRWESGKSFPQPRRLRRLCEALNIESDELVEADEWPQARQPKIAA